MRFAMMIEPQQGMSYEDILQTALTAEEAGFETFFRSDHYLSFPEPGMPTTDAWSTLAGLTRDTTSIGLGVLVSPVTFRLPGPLAKTVATVDEMSNGRVEVGLGAGWHEDEHRQFGIPFPPIGERLKMLDEQAAVLRGLWNGKTGWSFQGEHYQVENAHFVPQPPQSATKRRPHLIMGGEGRRRSCEMAAHYADEYNVVFASPERAKTAIGGMKRACDLIGRDPGELVYSALCGVLIAENSESFEKRKVRQNAVLGSEAIGVEPPAERAKRWILGTPEKALERIAELEDVGIERIVLHNYLPGDLDMIRILGKEIIPQFPGPAN